MKLLKADFFLFIILLLIGISSRTIFHLGPNLEIVTAISVVSIIFFHNKILSFLLTFLIMFATDLIIGNSKILIFTWSAFLVFPIISSIIELFRKKLSKSINLPRLFSLQSAGIISVIIFYLWTNLGVVIVSEMYQKNIFGLIQSYINAIPFLQYQLISSLISIPILYLSIKFVYRLLDISIPKTNLLIFSNLHLKKFNKKIVIWKEKTS